MSGEERYSAPLEDMSDALPSLAPSLFNECNSIVAGIYYHWETDDIILTLSFAIDLIKKNQSK